MAVIEVSNLQKSYGKLEAVKDVTFSVEQGEIFGIVGPNGAGKTTTVECIEGLRDYDNGFVSVLGLDPLKQAKTLKQRIGIQLQEGQLPDRLKVWEALDLFSSLYKKSVPWRPLLDELGLAEKSNDYFDNLSGGQKQRLSIAMALVNDPEVVFFDELTTGLDPQARHTIWDLVKRIRDKGKTVILVTHFMEEAERLCDRVAIIDHGRVIALDTPKKLIRQMDLGINILFGCENPELNEYLLNIPNLLQVECSGGSYKIYADNIKAVADIIHILVEKELNFYDFSIQQPNLEDVFISLTGRKIRD